MSPPKAGPTTCASDALPISLLVASVRCFLPTMFGNRAAQAVSKKTDCIPVMTAMASRMAKVRSPLSAASGIMALATIRPRLVKIMMGRRGRRSAQAPAKKPMARRGAGPAAESIPICNGDASSVMAAISGTAKMLIWEPNWLMVSAAHTFRKSASWSRPLRCQRIRLNTKLLPKKSGSVV